MPVVPTFKPNTNLSPMPGVRQQDSGFPAAFGAGVAQATERVGGQLAQVGGELAQLGSQIQQRQDSVAAKDAYQMASEQVLTLMHDPQNGLLSKRGGQARGLTNQATKELQRIQGEATKKLTSAQRAMFDSFWRGTHDSSVTSAARHEADQIRVAEDQTNDAIIDNASSSVAANAYDPKTIQHHIEVGMGTLASKYRGASEDVYQAAAREFKTKAFSGAIYQMLNDGRPAEAKKMFEAHREEMDQRLTGKLDEAINHMNDQAFAQQTGDTLMMKYPNPEEESKAMDDIQKMGLDPEKRLMVEQRVQALFSDKRRYEQAKTQARIEEVTGSVFVAPSMSAARQMIDGITDKKVRVQAEQAFRIRFAEEIQLQAHARSIAMSQSAAERAQGKQDAKYDQYQTIYESIPAAIKADPEKTISFIRKSFAGVEEENLVRYALGRMQEERPRAARITEQEKIVRTLAQQEVVNVVRSRIDEKLKAKQPVTPAQIYAWVTSPEFTAKDGTQMIENAGVEDLIKYAHGEGLYGEVRKERVNVAIRSLGIKDSAGKIKDLDNYPGVYKMVIDRLPPGSKPTDADIEDAVKKVIIDPVGTIPGWWGRNPATAFDAVKNGVKFNVDADPNDAKFLQNLASIIPTITPRFKGLQLNDEQKQEFVDQVLSPDLTAGQPPAISAPGVLDLNWNEVRKFYAWAKRTKPEYFGKLNSPDKLIQLFNIYKANYGSTTNGQ